MNQLHLLRPEWLLALIPLIILLKMWQSRQRRAGNLSSVCDPRLLPYLLIDTQDKPASNQNLLIGIGGLLAILALAGPSWNKLEQPVYRQQSSLVILLDLSSSMNGTDIEPSRLVKARFKLLDILKRRKEGQTALIVYAAQPFVVTPLTDDSATISSLVNSLTPEIMPSQGSRSDLALQRGIDLLQQSGAANGDLLFVTDGIGDDSLHNILQLQAKQYRINALGIGTTEGSPIPLAEGGFVQDQNGNIVVDKLDEQRLIKLVSAGGGVYSRLTFDDRDIDALLSAMTAENLTERAAETTLSSDNWREEGPWLILLLLPLAALAFRRGYLGVLMLLVLPIPQPAHALEWSDLWLRPDQQAARTLAAGDPQQAAGLFEDDKWRAAAHYRAGDYQQSLDALEATNNADSNYNKGNALARLGQLPEAIEAYQQALSLKPKDEDAQYNLELVKKLLQQQQQQQQQQQENQANQENQQEQSGETDAQPQQEKEQNQAGEQDSEEKQQASNNDSTSESQQQNQSGQEASMDQESQDQEEQESTAEQPDNSATEAEQETADAESQAVADNMPNAKEREQEQESTRQWLRRVPDDPGGLLRRKFLYQYKQQFQGRAESQPW